MNIRSYKDLPLTRTDDGIVLDDAALDLIDNNANAATPGWWRVRTVPADGRRLPDFVEAPNAHPSPSSAGIGILGDPDTDYIHREGDMAHVTTAQPIVARALTAEIRRLRALLAEK
jgi:hypothetical protein